MTALLVAVGAAIGCPARYLVWWAFNSRELFAWGTLAVNVAASLLLGVTAAHVTAAGPSASATITIAFCGAFSTYSTFAVEAEGMGGRRGAMYASLTLATGLAAAAIGWQVGTSI
ncbi:MAG: CrcB family protein [Nocardioidaceae bacterium]|nr:CrcB family protein [Nocardioidaceae bacterium]